MRIPAKAKIHAIRKGEYTQAPAAFIYFESAGHDMAIFAGDIPAVDVWCQSVETFARMDATQSRKMLDLVFGPIFPSKG